MREYTYVSNWTEANHFPSSGSSRSLQEIEGFFARKFRVRKLRGLILIFRKPVKAYFCPAIQMRHYCQMRYLSLFPHISCSLFSTNSLQMSRNCLEKLEVKLILKPRKFFELEYKIRSIKALHIVSHSLFQKGRFYETNHEEKE